MDCQQGYCAQSKQMKRARLTSGPWTAPPYGIVLELETDTPKSRVGSVHAYESYVSLEFAQGTLLKGHLAALSDKTRLRRAGWSRSLSV